MLSPLKLNVVTEPTRTPKPLPREIYVRRRLAALVAILVLVVILIWAATALFGGSSEDKESQPAAASSSLVQPSEQPTTSQPEETESEAPASESDEDQPSEEGAEDAEKSEESQPTELAVDPAKTECSLEDLKVMAKTNEDSIPGGKMPTFYMEVFNPTTKDCSIDLDEQQLRFEVYKMGSNERVWSDTDCYASVETGKQTFKSGETRFFQADWSRKRSEPGQCTDRPEADSGAYFLHTVIGDNYSAALPFNLL